MRRVLRRSLLPLALLATAALAGCTIDFGHHGHHGHWGHHGGGHCR